MAGREPRRPDRAAEAGHGTDAFALPFCRGVAVVGRLLPPSRGVVFADFRAVGVAKRGVAATG